MEAGQATAVNIERALQIDGWMSEPELHWLAEQAQNHSRILEIGSHLGRSTAALAANTEGTVWAFDDWFGPRDVSQVWDSYSLANTFVDNMKDFIQWMKVRMVRGNHAHMDSILKDFTFDMIFIDGSHDYASVKRDIQAAKRHSRGMICGHDYWLADVHKAVSEEFDSVGVVESIWYHKGDNIGRNEE